MVHAMIDALPAELRLPLVLSAFNEINSREIGKILDIPEGTVRTRLQRARQMLCSKLAPLRRFAMRQKRISTACSTQPRHVRRYRP